MSWVLSILFLSLCGTSGGTFQDPAVEGPRITWGVTKSDCLGRPPLRGWVAEEKSRERSRTSSQRREKTKGLPGVF